MTDNSIKPYYAFNIKEMRSPKFWPIVEEVNGKIHVLDSYHCSTCFRGSNDWMFSHEVKEDGGWREVDTSGLPPRILISNHLVVGHRIYAVDGDRCLVFDCDDDSEKQSWQMHYRESREYHAHLSPYFPRTVWDILCSTQLARCVGEFGKARSKADGKLYIIMAFVETLRLNYPNMSVDFWPEGYKEVATYVMDSMGNIICMDRRPFFFEGKTIQLYSISKARVITADKEGKTMSAIVVGDMIRMGGIIEKDYLFVCTFTVEEIYGAANEVRQMIASGLDHWIYEACFERPLVLFDVEGFHIYKVDAGIFEGMEGMEACFQF